jgi:hypothetical protein
MKTKQFIPISNTGLGEIDAGGYAAGNKFCMKYIMPVSSKRMPGTKTIGGGGSILNYLDAAISVGSQQQF